RDKGLSIGNTATGPSQVDLGHCNRDTKEDIKGLSLYFNVPILLMHSHMLASHGFAGLH
ncbi:6378_t:CDS:1, partial [Acaulospora colombiana]